MPYPPIRLDSESLDLSKRIVYSKTVTGSPVDDAETIVCTTPAIGNVAPIRGVLLIAYAAFTVGTNGVSVNFKIRQTDASGTTVVATGLTNEGVTAATQLGTRLAVGFDTAPVLPGQVYVATMIVTSGSAASTVSAASLVAIVV